MALLLESVTTEIGGILIIFFTSIIIFAKYRNTYWTRHGITQKEPVLFFGNIRKLIFKQKSFGDEFWDLYKHFRKKALPIGGIYIALKKELMIIDLDLIKHVMIKDFQHFTDRGVYVNEKIDPLTGNLFALKGKKWKQLRGKLTPTFTSGKMKMMFPTLVDTSKELDNVLNKTIYLDEPVDIKEILSRFTIDVIGTCAFGIECNSLKKTDTEFKKYGDMTFEPQGFDIIRQVLNLTAPWLLNLLKIRHFNKRISKFFINLVKDTISYREKNNIFRKDFMHLLIQLKNQGRLSDTESVLPMSETNGDANGDDIRNLTTNEIAAQSFVFFLAGYETSSTTMTFALYELAQNQDIQEKLRKEINNVLKKYDGELTYEGIMEMSYMEKIISETLRKYPPLPFLVRQCTQDWHVPHSDYVVRRGEYVRISVLGIHRDPDFYSEPDIFDPERFSEEQKTQRHPCAYMPFGEGPRICVGMRFGIIQTKVGLAVVLKNNKVTVNSKTKVPLIMDPSNFLLSTKGGVWLNVKRIKI